MTVDAKCAVRRLTDYIMINNHQALSYNGVLSVRSV